MISKQEVMDFSRKHNLLANTIEKDYVLNWILKGIANSSILSSNWVFKSGTCLKKCYFEDYRFSEDLDFTIIDPSHINNKFLMPVFINIGKWIYDQSGIDIPSMQHINSHPDKQDLMTDWEDMLSQQIAGLNSYEYYWKRLSSVFHWLYGDHN